jgi:hypothetical protein
MPRRQPEHERELPKFEEALSYSVPDACRVTGWAEPKLYEEIKAKRVESYTLGRRRFVGASSLRTRVAQLLAEATPIRPEARFHGRDGRRNGRQAQSSDKP